MPARDTFAPPDLSPPWGLAGLLVINSVYRGLLLSLSILSREQRELMLVVKTITLSRELLGMYG